MTTNNTTPAKKPSFAENVLMAAIGLAIIFVPIAGINLLVRALHGSSNDSSSTTYTTSAPSSSAPTTAHGAAAAAYAAWLSTGKVTGDTLSLAQSASKASVLYLALFLDMQADHNLGPNVGPTNQNVVADCASI